MDKLTAWIAGERGRHAALAAACGITHAAISQWVRVPAERVRAVSNFTGIPLNELRPDLYDNLAEVEG